jgi:hypothetical protein
MDPDYVTLFTKDANNTSGASMRRSDALAQWLCHKGDLDYVSSMQSLRSLNETGFHATDTRTAADQQGGMAPSGRGLCIIS